MRRHYKHRSKTRHALPPGVKRKAGARPRHAGVYVLGQPTDVVHDLLCEKHARELTDEQKRQVIDRFVAPMWNRLVGRLGPRATAQRLEWATTHVADALWRACRSVTAIGTAKDLALWAYERGIVR